MVTANLILTMVFLLGISTGMSLTPYIIKFFLKRGQLPRFMKQNKQVIIELLKKEDDNCVAPGSAPGLESKANDKNKN